MNKFALFTILLLLLSFSAVAVEARSYSKYGDYELNRAENYYRNVDSYHRNYHNTYVKSYTDYPRYDRYTYEYRPRNDYYQYSYSTRRSRIYGYSNSHDNRIQYEHYNPRYSVYYRY